MPLTIAVRYLSGAVVLAVQGRLTGADGTELREQMLREFEAGHRCLVLDCDELEACDSYSLGELVAAHASMVRRGGHVRLLRPHRRFEELLAITGLNRLFEVYRNEQQALASFTAAAGIKEKAALDRFLNPDE